MPHTHFDAFEVVECGTDVEVECQLGRDASWKRGVGASACVEIDNVAYSLAVPIYDPVVAIERWLIAAWTKKSVGLRSRIASDLNVPYEDFPPCSR